MKNKIVMYESKAQAIRAIQKSNICQTQRKTNNNGRKNRSDGLKAKEKILQGARKLFLELGYDAVTNKDISQATNTNVAAINYHFTDREGLISEVEALGHIPSYKELLSQLEHIKQLKK